MSSRAQGDFAVLTRWGWCGRFPSAPLTVVVSMDTVLSVPPLSLCLGSMLGTQVCSSLRSRPACWAAPSTTRCAALWPSRSTPLSPLLSLCRGRTPSTSSTSTCGTAARRRPRQALLFHDGAPCPWTEAHAPDQPPRGSGRARAPQTGGWGQCGGSACQSLRSRKTTDCLGALLLFPVGMSGTN